MFLQCTSEFGLIDLLWTATEHQRSKKLYYKLNKSETNFLLILGEMGSAASCTSEENKHQKMKNRHICSLFFSKSTRGQCTCLWPQTKELDHFSQQGWNMDQWSWGLQRLATPSQVCRLSSSIFARCFPVTMTSHPCHVLSPAQIVWSYWNNIPNLDFFVLF